MRPPRRTLAVAALLAVTVGCQAGDATGPQAVSSASRPPSASATVPASDPPTPSRSPTERPAPMPRPVPSDEPTSPSPPRTVVPLTVSSRVNDHPTAEFAAAVLDTLNDPRGWPRAAYEFVLDDDAPYRVVLAEGDEVDELCLPYDTYGEYSCQNGPVVALNADRWRGATPQWTGDLADYRIMLVNHEVGHLLHMHHPLPQCPGDGYPAPIMMQQSTELGACTANPWPLDWEIELASQRREPLAPPPDHDMSDHQPSPPPER